MREGAQQARVMVDEVPEALQTRPLSLRAFDDRGMIVAAELADGSEMAAAVERLLADNRAAYVHAHFAQRLQFRRAVAILPVGVIDCLVVAAERPVGDDDALEPFH